MRIITMEKFQRILPAMIGGIFCCLLTAHLASSIRAQTGGMFVYPLDDSYIHLALARTFAFSHVWGIGPSEFASASSSPGWTLVLALADILFGSHLATPIFINLILVFLILLVANAALLEIVPGIPVWRRSIALSLIVIGSPLPGVALLGMEHTAQALSVLLLLFLAAKTLAVSPSNPVPAGAVYSLLASAVFAGLIRYEAVLAIAPVFIILMIRRRFSIALLFALCSTIGPIAFAWFFYQHSGYLLPFSVMVKASQRNAETSHLIGIASMIVGKRATTPFVGVIIVAWLMRISGENFWKPLHLFLLLAGTLSVEHIVVAPVGWLMRYESYLVCVDLLAVFLVISSLKLPFRLAEVRLLPRPVVAAGVLVVLLSMMSIRAMFHRIYVSEREPVEAAVDRYHEHIQMVRLVADNFDQDTIVLDDIGAVAFYTHAHILDVIGLGSSMPLRAQRLEGHFDFVEMDKWATAEHATIAILQDSSPNVHGCVPPSWTPIQRWQQPRNVVFGDLTTTFYAVNAPQIPRLCRALSKLDRPRDDLVIFDTCPAQQAVVQQ